MTARVFGRRGAAVAVLLGGCLAGALAQTPPPVVPPVTPPTPRAAGAPSAPSDDECRVAGVRNLVQCGTLQRPLDPARPDGPRIAIRYAVVPAMARNKLPDPVFLLAGGPGQSAVGLIPTVMPLFQRLNNRRDVVFVDQRGTGGSAPLECPDDDAQPLAAQAEPERQRRFVQACKAALVKLPHVPGETALGHYTTWVAMRDVDAVRAHLGYEQVNLVGGSYGTRAGLEYLRQFPDRVRRLVLDGVAPPDMVLPQSAEPDNDAAWRALVAACAAEPACERAHPRLGERVQAFLARLPREASARQPLTGATERFTLTREMVLAAIRGALYAPALAAALPEAVDRATRGDLEPLTGLGATLLARRSSRLALGMHLSVVCAEDLPRLGAPARGGGSLSASAPAPVSSPSAVTPASAPGLFGDVFASQYQRLCADWPRGPVPEAFYTVARSPVPVLVLSGGLDPVTPPRHGARVAGLLGPRARHVVVANAGHGVMAVGCMREVIGRFIDAATPEAAQGVDADCAQKVPRPPAFVSIGAARAAASAAAASAGSGR